MACDDHWAVDEGRLDESPFYFMAMGGCADKSFLCLVSIVLSFPDEEKHSEVLLSAKLLESEKN